MSSRTISKPECVEPLGASAHYTASEAVRYTGTNGAVEREMAVQCLGLLLGRQQSTGCRPLILLDLGIGSGLSAHVLREGGHMCLGDWPSADPDAGPPSGFSPLILGRSRRP